MKKQFLLLLFSLFAVLGFSQRTITGTVTSAEDGEPIIGASVLVKGTSNGAATDLDGKFSIKANDKDYLVFSYVGMTSSTIQVGARSEINVVLKSNSKQLDEIVVTAMGQVQEKKKLNFAVQSLDNEQLTAGGSANFANDLQGKVSGLQVNTQGGSPNGSTSIIIRAISSVSESQSNEPLFIIDGMPMRGSSATSLGDINPSDIETMTVLKGAAASALYGQEAANGAILITTKSGKNGKVAITANGSWEVSNAVRVPKTQRMFIPGSAGFYKDNTSGGFGPLMGANDKFYDNVGDFLKTGFMQKYDVSASGGNEKFSAYASAAYMKNEGIVPEDYKDKLNFFVKGNFNPSKQVKMQLSSNFINTKSRGFGNSMSSVYNWPINNQMSDYLNEDGSIKYRATDWSILTTEEKINYAISPYYGRKFDKSETNSTRFMINGQISYEPIKNLEFTGKVAYDKGFSSYESTTSPRINRKDYPLAEDQAIIDKYPTLLGAMYYAPSNNDQLTVQGLATYQLNIAKDFTFNALIGGEYKVNHSTSAVIAGREFLLEDLQSFSNLNDNLFSKDGGSGNYPLQLTHYKSNKYGYFGELRFDYKGMAQLSVTGRMDGSSAFKQVKANYFYPSVTAGVIFSELFHLSNSWFSYGKLRGNWAKVGKDCPARQFTRRYNEKSSFPDGGWGIWSIYSYATDLEPEMTNTWEIGADLRFFNSRTRLDVAYYSTTVDNQILTGLRTTPTSGSILLTMNGGSVENRGFELSLAQDILKMKDFSWTATLNFSTNRGRVTKLPDDVLQIQTGTQVGDIYSNAYLNMSTTSVSGVDYKRTEGGDIICDENGYPIISPTKMTPIGNREADCQIGLSSMFTYKQLSLSFLLDSRIGGDVVNATGRSLFSSGMHRSLEKYRDREMIVTGVVANADGTYRPNTTPILLNTTNINTYFYSVSSNFVEDGSYLRLSYVTLAYDFTKLLSANCPVKGIKASFTGRNLFLLTKYSGTDPAIQVSSSGGAGWTGFDNMQVPNTRSFNLSLNVTF